MNIEESTKPTSLQQKQYFYIVKGKDKTIRLDIENSDVLVNADGVLDCPIDTVLRKNNYTFDDLNSWIAKEIQFIVVKDGVDRILHTIHLNVNL